MSRLLDLTAELELTQKEIATLLGVTSRSVYNFRQKGMPSRPDGGEILYPWPAGLRWYIDYQVRLAQKEADDGEEGGKELSQRRKAAEADRAETDAELARIELARQRSLTMLVDDSAALVEGMLSMLNAGLGNFAGRWSAELIGIDSTQAMRAKLERAMDELRSTLCAAAEAKLAEGLDVPSMRGEESDGEEPATPDADKADSDA